MEWLILLTLMAYYGLQAILVGEMHRRQQASLQPAPPPHPDQWDYQFAEVRQRRALRGVPLGRLPGETSMNDFTPAQIRMIMGHFSDLNQKSTRQMSEKVDWKNEGF